MEGAVEATEVTEEFVTKDVNGGKNSLTHLLMPSHLVKDEPRVMNEVNENDLFHVSQGANNKENYSQLSLDSRRVGGDRNFYHSSRHNWHLHHRHHQQHFKGTAVSVRCHCNLSQCASSNYMCKSERWVLDNGEVLEPGCFVDSSSTTGDEELQETGLKNWNGRAINARRGCIELLPAKQRKKCSKKKGDPIFCCKNDMCSYPSSYYPSSFSNINSRVPYDPSAHRGITSHDIDHQVWLRAALIAVPICGVMILIALICVARRLLKGEEDFKSPERCIVNGSRSGIRRHQYSSKYPESKKISHYPFPSCPDRVSQQYHLKSMLSGNVAEPKEFLLKKDHCCLHSAHISFGGQNELPKMHKASFAHEKLNEKCSSDRDDINRNNSSSTTETEQLVTNSSLSCPCAASDTESLMNYSLSGSTSELKGEEPFINIYE